MRWREVEAEGTNALVEAGVDSPASEVRRLIEASTGAEGPEYHDVLDDDVTARRLATFDRLLARRVAGEPLQYVIGRWGFRYLDLFVDPRVLIPRPETEQVVDAALAEIDRLVVSAGHTYNDRLPVADLGTGSGAIALAVATERTHVDVFATDASSDALAVARANLAGVGRAAARVRLLEGDWFAALPDQLRGRLGVVVSNPPYVGEAEHLPDVVARFEPRSALVAGPTGLEDLLRLLDAAPSWLRPAGALVLEAAPGQTSELVAQALALGYAHAEVRTDLSGRPRAVVARVRG